jgi:hypothetical protein
MVANYDAMRNASKLTVQSETDKLKLMVQTAANQDRLTSITNKWNQILTKASAVFLPIIDVLLSAVIPVMDIAQGVFGWSLAFKAILQHSDTFMTVLGIIGGLAKDIVSAFKGLSFISKIAGVFSSIGKYLSPLFKFLGVFGGTFGKAIPVLGEIIMALQFIWNLGKRLIVIWNDPNMNLGEKILAGLKAVVGAVYDTLIQPFVDAWNWIKGLWGGNSPSKIGLSILTGIVSIGTMLFDALTSPFRHALAWIADKIPGMGKVAEKLRGGVNGLMNQPLETKVSASYIPAVQVTPNGTRIATNPDAKPVTTSDTTKESTRSLDDIFDMLKQLNDNLTSGKVKAGDVYLNASLVSSVMSRELSFNGNYGTNR